MRILCSLLLCASIATAPLAVRAATDVDSIVVAARQAAHSDHNAESARLFQQAIAAAPERRAELLPELSDQLTYSGKAKDAIPLYREALTAPTLTPDARRHLELGLGLAQSWAHQLSASLATYGALVNRNPRDIEALLGYARVLSWQDQLSPSLKQYRRILAIDPHNLEALENIARVESWRGRQRDAQRRARAILAEHPGDLSAALTLADSELWMGRPDRAAFDEGALIAAHPGDSGVRDLQGDLIDARVPQLRAATSIATSSDNLLIRSSTVETEFPLSDGVSSLGLRYEPISYIGQNSGSAIERRIGFFARDRFNDWSEINGTVSNDEVSTTGAPTRNLLLYDTYFTLWPNDSLRFDIGSRRQTYDNIISLRLGITAVFETFSVDFVPDENTRLTLRANEGSFTDGNRQGFEQIEFERAVERSPRLLFGLRATSYSFDEPFLNDGYFDPPRYQSTELTGHLYGNVRSRFYYDASGAYGREWVVNGGTRPTHAVHGQLSYVLSRRVSASIFYDNFDTRQSNSGFARTTSGLALQTKW